MLSLQESVRLYANLIQELTDDEYKDAARRLCKVDLFFLLTQVLGRRDLINQWYYERCREFEAAPDGYLDLWSRGSGKDIADTTPIFTPSGWTTHGELQVGDYVFNHLGVPDKVLATKSYTDSECYEIEFSYGEKIVAGSGHLWEINFFNNRRVSKTDERLGWEKRIYTTKELVDELEKQKLAPARHKISVDYAKPIELPDVWLFGDKFIKSITKVDTVPTKCIQVASGKYLVGDNYTVTHNSSIITFGATIQEVLRNPEITIGIFSITRAIATKFVEQLKLEMEGNKFLIELYPDIFEDNANIYKRWSSEKGLLIKRISNPKEATIEACGLIEGMPTGRHYQLLIYDDCATERSVSTPDMNQKTLSQWELSLNLCDPHNHRFRYIGTRYAKGDLYDEIMLRGAATPRIRVAVNPDGSSILWDAAYIKKRRSEMGSRTWASQILQDPSGEGNADFQTDWIRYYTKSSGWGRMNRYILVDPASTKSKRADYTCMIVFGVGADDNYYIIDIIRDKLNLTERAKTLFELVTKYKPIRVGYEKYGMNTDIDHIKYMMLQEQFHFPILPLGGTVLNKEDRIRRLIPLFEQGRIYIPFRGEIKHTNYNQQVYDPLSSFLEEFESFPYSAHDDVMDAMSRMVDKDMNVRRPSDDANNRVKKYGDYKILGR